MLYDRGKRQFHRFLDADAGPDYQYIVGIFQNLTGNNQISPKKPISIEMGF